MAETDYEAVSYVWGSDVRDQEIECDGRSLALTTNLFHVLNRIRQPHASRSIWADLICINQEDLDEKSHQVAIMGHIYRHASRVLIHMGIDDKGHGLRVCSLLDDVVLAINAIRATITEDWNTFPHPRPDDQILDDARWDSLGVLLEEPWFSRGWVVREAGFAQSGNILWANTEFRWEALMKTCIWLHKRGVKALYAKKLDGRIPLAHLEAFEDRNPDYAKLFTSQTTWVDQSLLGYLSLTRPLSLKDPRDRIYAFLELVENEERQIHIRPNYKDPFLRVYQQFAVEYIEATGYIGLLSNVEHDEKSLNSGIQSWVPRWDISLTRTGYAFAPADSGYLPLTSRDGSIYRPTVTSDTALKLKGALIDQVLYASDVLDSSTTTPDSIFKLWEAIQWLTSVSPYPRMNCLIVFIGTLMAGTCEGDRLEWLRSEAAFYLYMFEKSGYPDDLEPPSWLAQGGTVDLFHHSVKGYTHKRRIILTQRGYLGLAPAVARKGDSCGIIFGCTTPSILRPSSYKDNFQYLGATFMFGQHHWRTPDGRVVFDEILGCTKSKEWLDWNVSEQDIYLC
jgi:hypothetical protein